jgi:hypothetical protein
VRSRSSRRLDGAGISRRTTFLLGPAFCAGFGNGLLLGYLKLRLPKIGANVGWGGKARLVWIDSATVEILERWKLAR